jgi:hypothetical protein
MRRPAHKNRRENGSLPRLPVKVVVRGVKPMGCPKVEEGHDTSLSDGGAKRPASG